MTFCSDVICKKVKKKEAFAPFHNHYLCNTIIESPLYSDIPKVFSQSSS